jgi:hypothetical protein
MTKDTTPRYAPSSVMTLKGMRPVIKYIGHTTPPAGCPIKGTPMILEMKTEDGSVWWGFDEVRIDASLRMVVVGFPAQDELRSKWAQVEETLAAEEQAATWNGEEVMDESQAAEYGPRWGCGNTVGGCAMYNLTGGIESEAHRDTVLDEIDRHCIPAVQKDPSNFDTDELAQLAALRAYVVSATSKDIDGEDEDYLADKE